MQVSTLSVGRSSPNGRVRRNAGLKFLARSKPTPQREPRVSVGHGGYVEPDVRATNADDNISLLALGHGRYETVDAIYRKNLIESEVTPLVINRAVTVIDDWIDSDVFLGRQVRVIEKARDLWRSVKRPRHPYFDPPDPDDLEDSFESERAKSLLHRCRRLVGNERWNIFENIVRWNEPTGVPGSRIANINERSMLAAQMVVRDVADEIGRSWIL
jgi:hypothetical protein